MCLTGSSLIRPERTGCTKTTASICYRRLHSATPAISIIIAAAVSASVSTFITAAIATAITSPAALANAITTTCLAPTPLAPP